MRALGKLLSMPSPIRNPLENCTMNHLKFRTLLVAALTLTAAQASFAVMCVCYYEPPSGRNGWQPASTAKALPQTAAVQAPAGGMVYEPPSGRNGWQPAATGKSMPVSAAAKARLRSASGH